MDVAAACGKYVKVDWWCIYYIYIYIYASGKRSAYRCDVCMVPSSIYTYKCYIYIFMYLHATYMVHVVYMGVCMVNGWCFEGLYVWCACMV